MLENKVHYLISAYQEAMQSKDAFAHLNIKWDRELTKYLKRGIEEEFIEKQIVLGMYRPYVKMQLYFDRHFNGIVYQLLSIFPSLDKGNLAIWWKTGAERPQFALAIDSIPDVLPAGGSICFPLYRYLSDGSRVDNITDWALEQFKKKYEVRMKNAESKNENSSLRTHHSAITKLDIFHYVYAVLHHPAYRAKYEINLKREFPRIPFYEDFWQWAEWGKQLMELHLNYEAIEPFALERVDAVVGRGTVPVPSDTGMPTTGRGDPAPTCRLIARKDKGEIEIDTQTKLCGVPPEAWEYRLGTYSALEWILERYKEKKPKDPTIAEKFNTYKFADYKEQVIDLLCRVCTVSVETMKIVKAMPQKL